jgi:hypothetical protein
VKTKEGNTQKHALKELINNKENTNETQSILKTKNFIQNYFEDSKHKIKKMGSFFMSNLLVLFNNYFIR